MDLTYVPLILLAVSFFSMLAIVWLYTRTKEVLAKVGAIEQSLRDKSVEEQVSETSASITQIKAKIISGAKHLRSVKSECESLSDKLAHVNAGLAIPTFKVEDDETLKEQVLSCRAEQFRIMSLGQAVNTYTDWTFFGSKEDGAKLVKIYGKLLVRAMNSEFDLIRSRMKHSSYEVAITKFDSMTTSLERLAETVGVTISEKYRRAKLAEIKVWHKALVAKEQEKQERKKQKAMLRKQNKELGSSSEDDDELESQLSECTAELEKARTIAEKMGGDELAALDLKIAEIEEEKERLEEKFTRATSQAQITKAGYIYVISNLGSFGEDICKIGMTRRLEPMDRVVELGDASVPFRFDVHTLAFVDNAPELEKTLHNYFDSRRVNKSNTRKEFFRVSPREVHEAMESLDVKSPWYYERDAKQYRESQLIIEAMEGQRCKKSNGSSALPESI